jgi:hypothetical protein
MDGWVHASTHLLDWRGDSGRMLRRRERGIGMHVRTASGSRGNMPWCCDTPLGVLIMTVRIHEMDVGFGRTEIRIRQQGRLCTFLISRGKVTWVRVFFPRTRGTFVGLYDMLLTSRSRSLKWGMHACLSRPLSHFSVRCAHGFYARAFRVLPRGPGGRCLQCRTPTRDARSWCGCVG